MRFYTYILLLFSTLSLVGQQPPQKTIEIGGGGGGLQIDGIEIETPNSDNYKTLEIRYSSFDASSSEVVIEGTTYKAFRDKRSAIAYYNIVKKGAGKKVVYYVNSVENKTPETFVFRVTQ